MSQESSKEIESQFLKLKESMSVSEWKNPEHLLKVAYGLESDNPELYLRILQRIKYLNKLKLKKLNDKILKQSQQIDANKQEQSSKQSYSTGKQDSKRKDEKKTQQKEERPASSKTSNKLSSGSSSLFIKLTNVIKKPIILLVVMPWFLFAFYQTIVASPRYESQAKVIVKQPDAMATMDTGMAVLSGLGMTPTNSDAQLVVEYIQSIDMLKHIDDKLRLKEHYQSESADFISRLSKGSSQEGFLKYYNDHVKIEIDEKSQVISIYAQAYTPEYAQQLNKLIVNRAEWFINEVGRNLANEQLNFIKTEHEVIENRLATAKRELLEYQNKYSLLDPEAESAAMQQITYSIEAKIAEKKSELNVLTEVLSDQSSQVISLKNQIKALEEQLYLERERLSSNNGDTSVSQIISRFSDYKINVELAIQAYTSSLISLEKARVESYRQIKYLVTIEESTLPEDSSYPRLLYNLTLFAVVLLMLFGIGAIIRATINELN